MGRPGSPTVPRGWRPRGTTPTYTHTTPLHPFPATLPQAAGTSSAWMPGSHGVRQEEGPPPSPAPGVSRVLALWVLSAPVLTPVLTPGSGHRPEHGSGVRVTWLSTASQARGGVAVGSHARQPQRGSSGPAWPSLRLRLSAAGAGSSDSCFARPSSGQASPQPPPPPRRPGHRETSFPAAGFRVIAPNASQRDADGGDKAAAEARGERDGAGVRSGLGLRLRRGRSWGRHVPWQ